MKNLLWLSLLLGVVYLNHSFAHGSLIPDKIGKTSRVPMTSDESPWSSIGRVFFEADGIIHACTGTLVGERVVLTAAHCVIHDGRLARITFQPNYKYGRAKSEAQSVEIRVGTLDTKKHHDGDWAVILLNRPLGKNFGFLGLARPGNIYLGMDVMFAGYSNDYQKGQTATIDKCHILRRIDTWYGHDCMMSYGASGAPLFIESEGEYYILAINIRMPKKPEEAYKLGFTNEATWNDIAYDTAMAYRNKYH